MLALVLIFAGVVAAAHVVPFPFLLEAFRPSQSLWRMPAQGRPPTVYLTFDDGPNPRWTPALLDALRDTNVRATFFLIDEHITNATAPIVARIADEGHAIALHSGDRWLMLDSPDAMARRLASAADRIRGIAGQEPCRLFRPHGGWRSVMMYAGVRNAGYRLTGWSWGMWDWDWWQPRRGDRIARRLARKASPGDIIVIHDGHHRNPVADRRHAGETVRYLVPALRGRGFQFDGLC
jgi:peptidoglycan-N-acetylglucosamine deacetylase